MDVFYSSLVIRILFIFTTYLWSSYEIPLVFFQWTDKLAKIIFHCGKYIYIYIRDCHVLKTSSKRVARFLLSREEKEKREREKKKTGVSFLTNERTRV